MRKCLSILFLCVSLQSIGQKNCDALFASVEKLYDDGKLTEALSVCDKIIDAKCQDLAKAYFNRGIINDALEKEEPAKKNYQLSYEADRTFTQAYLELAKIYQLEKQFDKAQHTFDLLIGNNPDNPKLVIYRAAFFRETENYAAAIKDYAVAYSIDSSQPKMLINYGNCYASIGDTVKAIGLYSKSIKLQETPMAYWARGYLYKKMERFHLAKEDMLNTIKLDPKNAHAFLVLGNCYAELGDKHAATKAYQNGLALNPGYNYKALLELGLKNIGAN